MQRLSIQMLFAVTLCLMFAPGVQAEALLNVVRAITCDIHPQGTQVSISLDRMSEFSSRRVDENRLIIMIDDCYYPASPGSVATHDSLVRDITVRQAGATSVQITLHTRDRVQEKIFQDTTRKGIIIQVSEGEGVAATSPPTDSAPFEFKQPVRKDPVRPSVPPLPAPELNPMHIQTIVLDPGHGGFDSGAVGPAGLEEKEANLDIALRLARLMREQSGLRVFLTRNADYYVPLSERTIIANQYGADLFVSIHCNASTNRDAGGVEIYYPSESASDAEAARVAQRENAAAAADEYGQKQNGFVDIEDALFRFERKLYWEDSRSIARHLLGTMDERLGIKSNGVKYANFFVLRKARMPSVLFETAYLSNPQQERLLGSEQFRQTVARELFARIQSLLQDQRSSDAKKL